MKYIFIRLKDITIKTRINTFSIKFKKNDLSKVIDTPIWNRQWNSAIVYKSEFDFNNKI